MVRPMCEWLGIVTLMGAVALGSNACAQDLALGDSIARGTGEALGIKVRAVIGGSSCRIGRFGTLRQSWGRVVLSVGINDEGRCVAAVRAALKAQEVIWILPAPINGGRAAVEAAIRPGDKSVGYVCRGGCTKTNFHPRSYAEVADAVRKVW